MDNIEQIKENYNKKMIAQKKQQQDQEFKDLMQQRLKQQFTDKEIYNYENQQCFLEKEIVHKDDNKNKKKIADDIESNSSIISQAQKVCLFHLCKAIDDNNKQFFVQNNISFELKKYNYCYENEDENINNKVEEDEDNEQNQIMAQENKIFDYQQTCDNLSTEKKIHQRIFRNKRSKSVQSTPRINKLSCDSSQNNFYSAKKSEEFKSLNFETGANIFQKNINNLQSCSNQKCMHNQFQQQQKKWLDSGDKQLLQFPVNRKLFETQQSVQKCQNTDSNEIVMNQFQQQGILSGNKEGIQNGVQESHQNLEVVYSQ